MATPPTVTVRPFAAASIEEARYGTATPAAGAYRELFEDAEAREADWFRRTGVYPMHGTIVVKDAVLKQHPFVGRALFDAFSKAKNAWLEKLHSGAATTAGDKKYLDFTSIVGRDPLPYGMKANLATIRALEDTAFKQGLTPKRMTIEEIFVDPER